MGEKGGGISKKEGSQRGRYKQPHTCRAWQRSWPMCRVAVVTVTSLRGQAGLTHLPLQSEHRQPRAPFTSGGSSRFKNDGEKMEINHHKKCLKSAMHIFIFHKKSKTQQILSACHHLLSAMTQVLSKPHWSCSLSNHKLSASTADTHLFYNIDRKLQVHTRGCQQRKLTNVSS